MIKLMTVALGCALLLGSGCTQRTVHVEETTAVQPAAYVPEKPAFVQVGTASWYGEQFHGRKTASGERFDMHDHTAAHRTLPLNTKATVTNLENGRKVEVVVNDRGPYAEGRILDVSKAAATELGMKEDGLTKVRIEVAEADLPEKRRKANGKDENEEIAKR